MGKSKGNSKSGAMGKNLNKGLRKTPGKVCRGNGGRCSATEDPTPKVETLKGKIVDCTSDLHGNVYCVTFESLVVAAHIYVWEGRKRGNRIRWNLVTESIVPTVAISRISDKLSRDCLTVFEGGSHGV